MSDLVHHPHAPAPPLNTNLIAIVPTGTAPPASRKKAVSVSADASAMNGISVALANTKDQAKKRMGTALRHTSPPTGAVETDPQGGTRNISPTTALTALAASPSVMENPDRHINAHVHHYLSTTLKKSIPLRIPLPPPANAMNVINFMRRKMS